MRPVTIKDIAQLAHTSYATVSRALNGAPGVSAETRARILELCRTHGYRTNLLARSLSANRAGLLGVVVPDLDNPLFSEMSLTYERYARQRGYHVMLCHESRSVPGNDELFDYLLSHRVDGIILVGTSARAPAVVRRYGRQVPIVLQGDCDPAGGDSPIHTVSTGSALGGQMAAEYLHRLGHRRVVYLGMRENSVTHALRYEGFAETARHFGMAVQLLKNAGPASNQEIGYHLMKQFLFQNFKETAVFAACDALALGAMQAADEFGIAIPDRLSLMGFDNIAYAALPNIRLTTLDQNKKLLAETTVDCLLAMLDAPTDEEPRPILIPPTLLERDSCRAI